MDRKIRIEFADNGVMLRYDTAGMLPTVHENRGGTNPDAYRAIGEYIFAEVEDQRENYKLSTYEIEVKVSSVLKREDIVGTATV